jgi:hypothetical protein
MDEPTYSFFAFFFEIVTVTQIFQHAPQNPLPFSYNFSQGLTFASDFFFFACALTQQIRAII